MKIVALKYGESVFGENNIFKGGRKDVLLPISFTIYLIQTEDKNILVDVGCDDGAGFEMSQFKKPVDVLKEYGLSPNDITDVIITHCPNDYMPDHNAVSQLVFDASFAASVPHYPAVQAAGGKRMKGGDFLNGRKAEKGQVFVC